MAAQTYSQIYIQVVFAVGGKQTPISPDWEEELYKYITGIISKKGQKLLAINGMPNHIHIFIGMKPSCCLSDLVREVKKASTNWVNENRKTPFKFNWQKGFGAFSYSHSALDAVIKYIANQKEHHKKVTFRDEYIAFLEKFKIDFEENYLFDFDK